LAQIKSMRGIVEWIVAHRPAVSEPSAAPASGFGDNGLANGAGSANGAGGAPGDLLDPGGLDGVPECGRRMVVRLVEVGPAERGPVELLASAVFWITDDGRGVALDLAERLESHGATARIVAAGAGSERDGDAWTAGEPIDGVIELSALGSDGDTTARHAYGALRAGAVAGARWLVGVSATGGRFGRTLGGQPGGPGLPAGAGMAGLCRTLAQELPGTLVRAVDVDPKSDPGQLADLLLAELLDAAGPVSVGYAEGHRFTLQVQPDAGSGAAKSDTLANGLVGPDSVVVAIGGGRGITATVTQALAMAGPGCRVVLAGRTELSENAEDPAVQAAGDAPSLRGSLVAAGWRDTSAIEAEVRRIMAQRELRRNLEALERTGAVVEYHVLDAGSGDAVRLLLDEVVDRHGRVDLVVHGAGIIDDKLVEDKLPEAFDAVFHTKVVAAAAAASWLSEHYEEWAPAGGPKPTLVLFGSVSGVFGNRGQADYAAANDALDTLAWSMATHPGVRVVSMDWGPWGGGAGMVSPQLEQFYRRRGVGLLDPEDAIGHLWRELADPSGEAQVVVVRAESAALAGAQ